MYADLNLTEHTEFNERIQTYDIVSCVETKLDDLDIVNVDNFVVVQKNRMQKSQMKISWSCC